MEVGSLLIAETDPAILLNLPQLLSCSLPAIDIHMATSTDDTQRKLSEVRYFPLVVAPHLVKKTGSLRLHKVRNRSELMPVLVTATKANVDAAHEALLYRGAFDVITKPLHPTEAIHSIRVALWQARFLRLLTQRERVLKQFERHIEEYPKEVETRTAVGRVLDQVESTLTAVRQSMTLIEPASDRLFFDLAISIQERTQARALDRLNRLIAPKEIMDCGR